MVTWWKLGSRNKPWFHPLTILKHP
jgi:hypothetical protein